MSDVKQRPISNAVNSNDWLVVQGDEAGLGDEQRVRVSDVGVYGVLSSTRKTVALLGDSYVLRDTTETAAGYRQNYIRSIFEWTNIQLGKRLDPIYWDGVNGSTVESFLTRLDAALATSADYVYVQGSVNNFSSAATPAVSVARQKEAYLEIINRTKNAGKTPIITTIPASAFLNSDADYDGWIDINNWFRTVARDNGAIISDYASACVSASLTGQPNTIYLDGGSSSDVHRNVAGAIRDGKFAADSLAPFIPKWDVPWNYIYSATSTGPARGIVNPTQAGTGGTAATGASGVIAAGNTLGVNTGAGTVVGSKVARTDKQPGEWQQIVFNPDAANRVAQYYNNVCGLGGKAVGDDIEVFCEIEVDDANINLIKGLEWRIYFVGATTERSYQFVDYQADTFREGFKGILSTPRRTIPAGATGLSWGLNLTSAAAGAGVTYRVGRMTIL